eukprot:12359720-Alexandrium_andersonii.AAC.1
MVLAIMTVLVRKSTWAQTRSPELSRGPFCAVVRAEREHGNDNLPGAPWGLVVVWLLALGVEVVVIAPATVEGAS